MTGGGCGQIQVTEEQAQQTASQREQDGEMGNVVGGGTEGRNSQLYPRAADPEPTGLMLPRDSSMPAPILARTRGRAPVASSYPGCQQQGRKLLLPKGTNLAK